MCRQNNSKHINNTHKLYTWAISTEIYYYTMPVTSNNAMLNMHVNVKRSSK